MLNRGWLAVAIAVALVGCSKQERPPSEAGQKAAAGSGQTAVAESLVPVPLVTRGADSLPAAAARPARSGTDTFIPAPGSLTWMINLVGQTPFDVQLWRTVPTARRLYNLLGPQKYERFLINMQESTVILGESGIYYVLGNKKYGGGRDLAAFVADVDRDYLYVWLLLDGTPEEHAEEGWAAPLPQAVRDYINKAAAGR